MTAQAVPREGAARFLPTDATRLAGDPEDTLAHLTSAMSRGFRTPIVYVALADGDRFLLLAHQGVPQWIAARGGFTADSSVLADALDRQRPTLISDLGARGDLRDCVEHTELGIAALAIVPLALADHEVIGALCAGQPDPHDWTDEDAAIFSDLGSAATLILRHRNTIRASGALSAGIGKLSVTGRALTEQVRRLAALISDDDDPRVRTLGALASGRVQEVEATLRELEAIVGTNRLEDVADTVTTDIVDVVRRSVKQAFGVEADRAEIRVDADAASAQCDPLEVERSLTTLLTGIRLFAAGTEGIHVHLFTSRENVHINIVDVGQGIPAAELSRLVASFKPASGAPISSLQLGDGSVRAQSGAVRAESSSRGTSFEIALPRG